MSINLESGKLTNFDLTFHCSDIAISLIRLVMAHVIWYDSVMCKVYVL